LVGTRTTGEDAVNETTVRVVIGAAALAAKWGTEKLVNAAKDAGYNVPEWVEKYVPDTAGLAGGVVANSVVPRSNHQPPTSWPRPS
jgi:hypothetical protein